MFSFLIPPNSHFLVCTQSIYCGSVVGLFSIQLTRAHGTWWISIHCPRLVWPKSRRQTYLTCCWSNISSLFFIPSRISLLLAGPCRLHKYKNLVSTIRSLLVQLTLFPFSIFENIFYLSPSIFKDQISLNIVQREIDNKVNVVKEKKED